MNSRCSVELLESALAGELPSEREEILQCHLDECEACVAALEKMAGGDEAGCREAAALLTGDEIDQAVPSREEGSDVDFTVEHLEPSDEPDVLGRLGGYDVLQVLGHGGMSVVLKAHDRELNRHIAIKVLSPRLAQSSLAKKRFIREAQAAAAVVHPHVIAIHQVQPNGRLPFLVMPLVAGESLAQRLGAQGRLELKETLRIGMQAAAGLAAAHEQGIVHRDVKPANILLEKGVERAVLTDFGLARAADDVSMTRWGIIAGTPQYMSPEQARGEPLDGRSDLFSLGCVLYEMASGVSPFRADSTLATLRRLIDDPPPALASLDPGLPPWFIAIVERLLDKDPGRRFASAKEVSQLLEGCLAHLQQPSGVPLPATLAEISPRCLRKPRKLRFRGVTIMLALLGISLFAAAVVTTAPPSIAGPWSGEDWGRVVLTPSAAGEYSGTFSDTLSKQPGKLQLRWSRIERRFNGTWSEGPQRFGELSVRLVGNEIRGALTTDLHSKINPATPRLADLLWTRAEAVVEAPAGAAAHPPSSPAAAAADAGKPGQAPAPESSPRSEPEAASLKADLTQDASAEILADGTIRAKATITQRNADSEPLNSLGFVNSDFVHVQKMYDAHGRPLKFAVTHSDHIFRYQVPLLEAVPPGQEYSFTLEDTESGLVKPVAGRPGVYRYHMRHWPAVGEFRTRRIERFLLPPGAQLVEKSPADLNVRKTGGQIELFIDRLIPGGDSLEVDFTYRLSQHTPHESEQLSR